MLTDHEKILKAVLTNHVKIYNESEIAYGPHSTETKGVHLTSPKYIELVELAILGLKYKSLLP